MFPTFQDDPTPNWSDLSNASPTTRLTWANETTIRNRYRSYFDGTIFQTKVPVETDSGEEAPLMYPVGINLVKMLCTAMADSAFGEWDEHVLSFEIPQDEDPSPANKSASLLANTILSNSKFNTLAWEMELDRNIYGGAPMRIAPDLTAPGHIRWSRIMVNNFYPVFDPDDPDEIMEAYVVTGITREQARLKYGINPEGKANTDVLTRVEKWNRQEYTNTIEGIRIDQFSGINPWHIVPFVYTPRLRTSHVWGDSLAEDIIPVQDELNARIADVGDAVNYDTHPIKWSRNLQKAFIDKNFPVGPNVMWDLGKAIGSNPPPEVGILEAKNPVPPGTFEYIKFLYDWTRTSSFAPPIAFGEDTGGGQRSGITLELRMWPLIKAIRRGRSYLSESMKKALKISAIMLSQKSFSDVSTYAIDRLMKGALVPRYATIMPRDQAAIVDEVVKRFSTTPPTLSLETAVKKLGDGTAEVEKITSMLENDEFYQRVAPANSFGGPNGGNSVKGSDGRAAATRTDAVMTGEKQND